MQKLYLGTNTKMFKTIAETKEYLKSLRDLCEDAAEKAELFVIPSYTSLDAAGKCLSGSPIRLGAQNMCWEERGAFTGEISPLMLRETGVSIVELGHSERRHVFGETNDMIYKKVNCAVKNGFTALLCVGETLEEKNQGIARMVIQTQLLTALRSVPLLQAEKLWVAYEPVWAIGSNGIPAGSDYAAEIHGIIRQTLLRLFGNRGNTIPILYGGSVNEENALPFLRQKNIDGLFIGRSAWNAQSFSRIIHNAVNSKN